MQHSFERVTNKPCQSVLCSTVLSCSAATYSNKGLFTETQESHQQQVDDFVFFCGVECVYHVSQKVQRVDVVGEFGELCKVLDDLGRIESERTVLRVQCLEDAHDHSFCTKLWDKCPASRDQAKSLEGPDSTDTVWLIDFACHIGQS